MTKAQRKEKIIELYSQGVPTSEIARKLRISEHEVVTVLINTHLLRD